AMPSASALTTSPSGGAATPPPPSTTAPLTLIALTLLVPRPDSPLFPYTTLFRSTVPRDGPRVDGRRATPCWIDLADRARRKRARSEEHTSELQSHLNLVCRLLLEKKNDTLYQMAGAGAAVHQRVYQDEGQGLAGQ